MDLGPPAGPPDPTLLYDSGQMPVQNQADPYTETAAKRPVLGRQRLGIVVSVGLSRRNPGPTALDGNRYCRMRSEAMSKGLADQWPVEPLI